MELYLLGAVGVLLHYGKTWVAANKKGMKYDLKKAIPMAALSMITTWLCVYLGDDIKTLYVITPFSSVLLGYSGSSTFFSFLDTKKPKITKNNRQ